MAFERWTKPASGRELGTGVKASAGRMGGGGTRALRLTFSAERLADFDIANAFDAAFAVLLGKGDDAGRVRIAVDSAGLFHPRRLRSGGASFLLGPVPGTPEKLEPTWCGWRQIDEMTIEISLPWASQGVTPPRPDPARALVQAAKRPRTGIGSYR